MRDIAKNWRQWLAAAPGADKQTRICNAVLMISVKYYPRLDSIVGRKRTHSEIVADAIQNTRALPHCSGIASLSVLGAAAVPLSLSLRATADVDSVTGAFEPYVDDINSAFMGTDGSPYEVYGAMDVIMAGATTLPYADYQLVATAASVAESSADSYADVDWGDTDICEEGVGACVLPAQYSVMIPVWLRKALVVGGADAVACGTHMFGNWRAALATAAEADEPIGWAVIAEGCGEAAFETSSDSFFSVLAD